jgi:PAS domain S-box-containing protein
MSQDSGFVPDPQERPVPRIEDIHRLLLNESPDPIFAFAPDGEYLYVNRAFAEGVQKRVEQILGRRIWDVFPREEADKRFAALNSVFQSGLEKVIEVRVPRTDRDHYYVTTITPIKDAQGRVSTVICSSKDITERKQAELALKESEEINRVISGLTTDYSFIVDITPLGSLQLRWASQNLAEITGRGLDESATPDQWRAIIHQDDLPLFFAFVQRTLETGEASTLECRSLVHSGRTRWIQISAQPQIDEMGCVRTIYGAVKEISERKWAEMALRESEARMAAFMEYVPAMILIKDHEFRPIFANTRFRERFPFEDWLQKTPHDLFPPDVAEAMVQMDTRALEEGSITFEEFWKDQNGVQHQYRTTKFRIDLAGAQPLIGAIILDITDQKRAEEDREKLQDQLLQAQKMESIGRLAGGVAHDFSKYPPAEPGALLREPLEAAERGR